MDLNHICQVEIRVKDLVPNAEYYANTFSWKINVVSEDYAMVDTGAAPIGGLLQVPGDGKIPIGISPYVLVENCAETFERGLSLGGTRCLPPIELEGAGVYATGDLAPEGLVLELLELSLVLLLLLEDSLELDSAELLALSSHGAAFGLGLDLGLRSLRCLAASSRSYGVRRELRVVRRVGTLPMVQAGLGAVGLVWGM